MSTKKISMLCIIFIVSISLMLSGLTTITLAYPTEKSTGLVWNVYYSDIVSTSDDIVNNMDRISFLVDLKNQNDEYNVTLKVNNTGTIDAVLDMIEMKNLKKEFVGTGKSGKIYYLSDYIDVTLSYANTNKVNRIVANQSLQVGDKLVNNTSNDIKLNIKFKKNLSKDQLDVIYGEKTHGVKFEMYLSTVYQQAK